MSEVPIHWTSLPKDPAALRECGAAIDQVRSGQTEIVKDGPYRTIHRVHLDSNDLHVKHCKVRGVRAWLREWLRPAKAKLEFRKLAEALRRNVPTIQPVAYGVASRLPGDSYLVTRTVTGAMPLSQFLGGIKGPIPPRRRMNLAVSLGEFLARAHHAGLLHPDLHPGNILIRITEGAPDFFLIDLHDARIGRSLSPRASLANLVVFNRWFSLRSSRTDRLRFWRAYVIERARLAGRMVVDYFACRELERRTGKSNVRFWRRRLTRSLGGSRHFVAIAGPAATGFVPRRHELDELQQLLTDLDAPFRHPQARILKDSPSSTVAEIPLSVNGAPQTVIYKRFRCRSRWQALRSLIRRTKCLRSWMLGHAFLDCLLPTARPLAAFERRRRGRARDGYLITEKIENAIDLRQAFQQPPKRRERIELAARLIRQLHERGWSHRDLKAPNILLAPDACGVEHAWFIDLVGAHRPIWLSPRRRMRDLARLNASFLDAGCLSRADRLRFLLCYLNAGLHGRKNWKGWWRGIGELVERKVAKNHRRGRPLA